MNARSKGLAGRGFCFILLATGVLLFSVGINSGKATDAAKKSGPNGSDDALRGNLQETVGRLQNLENRMSWEKQWEAAEWISAKLREYGLETVLQKYEWNGRVWPNVIARIQGGRKPGEAIMVLAHLDSISYDPSARAPGADDNASGVAVAMEMGKILTQAGLERSLVIAIFSNEERGRAGSKAYVASLKGKQSIKAVINLDVLGYARPAFALQLAPLWHIGHLRGKARAIYRMCKNLYYGLFYPRKALIVAGRPANGNLANLVAKTLEKGGDVSVRTVVGDDCG